jgi:hypothetical protein
VYSVALAVFRARLSNLSEVAVPEKQKAEQGAGGKTGKLGSVDKS